MIFLYDEPLIWIQREGFITNFCLHSSHNYGQRIRLTISHSIKNSINIKYLNKYVTYTSVCLLRSPVFKTIPKQGVIGNCQLIHSIFQRTRVILDTNQMCDLTNLVMEARYVKSTNPSKVQNVLGNVLTCHLQSNFNRTIVANHQSVMKCIISLHNLWLYSYYVLVLTIKVKYLNCQVEIDLYYISDSLKCSGRMLRIVSLLLNLRRSPSHRCTNYYRGAAELITRLRSILANRTCTISQRAETSKG